MSQGTARQRRRDTGPLPWLAAGAGALAVLALAFALGGVVGRQWPSHAAREGEPSEAGRKAVAAAPRRSGLVEPVAERPALPEKLTFYQTLTAPMPATAVSTQPAAKPAPPQPAAKPRPAEAPPSAVASPTRPADARAGAFTVQVGSFKDRGQAESVRKPLAAANLDVSVATVPAEDGTMRYKVRVGAFKTRDDAARMAERIRQERSLPAFVAAR